MDSNPSLAAGQSDGSRFRFGLRALLIAISLIAVAMVAQSKIRFRWIEREMLANVEAQLADDILAYEWLHAIADYHHPRGTPIQHCRLVNRTVQKLLARELMVIGPASSGVTIRPWTGTIDEQSRRVEKEIFAMMEPSNSNERFRFWIGLPETASDR